MCVTSRLVISVGTTALSQVLANLTIQTAQNDLPFCDSFQVMMSRLQEFTLQYNAQCDSLNPKTREHLMSHDIVTSHDMSHDMSHDIT